MQFRIFRYRESYNSESADQLYEVEFRHERDPRLSVYEIGGEPEACRIQLEHKAGAGIDPPRGGWGVDLDALGNSTSPNDPGGRFEFRRKTHRILHRLKDADDVRELSDALFREIQDGLAHIKNSKDELRSYLRSRVAAGDPEWSEFLDGASKAWKKLAGK